MSKDMDLVYETKQKMLIKYPRFGSEIATSRIEFRDDLKYHTAATDGNNVYVDPNYFTSLSEDDRLFLIAHEILHIKFMHPLRLKDKKGNMRDIDIWNEACDAIINANLERDGFTIRKEYINRPEALNYTAEEFYDMLLREKKGQRNENGDKETFCDDHGLWEEAFRQAQREDSNIKNGFDEKSEFSENRKEKIEKFKAKKSETERKIRGELKDSATINFGDIGKGTNEINWKLLIHKAIENNQTIWSQRRSIAENNYAYRLEENEQEEEAITEVMIDVSGSVKLELIKAFLRELKSLLKESKLKVGCFNAEFWGMVDVKNEHDIDNFTIPKEARGHAAWTEDMDLAVRSFSKDRKVNKIVFTDGGTVYSTMPRSDLKNENVIWLVYGYEKFRPCCGKVINVNEKQIKKIHQQTDEIYR